MDEWQHILNEARHLVHLPEPVLNAIQIGLLYELPAGGGGGGGPGGLYVGSWSGNPPDVTPTEPVAIAFDRNTGAQWAWYDGAWH